jgi:hypothetical protein
VTVVTQSFCVQSLAVNAVGQTASVVENLASTATTDQIKSTATSMYSFCLMNVFYNGSKIYAWRFVALSATLLKLKGTRVTSCCVIKVINVHM